MSSYRRYVARHGAAIYRAKRQVRKHALETPPTASPATQEWAEETFRDFAERLRGHSFEVSFGPVDLDRLDERLAEMIGRGLVADRSLIVLPDPEPVLAYRGQYSDALRCTQCVSLSLIKLSIPLTSGDLPDGGICRVCGVDVLIPMVPNPCCTLCKHAPHDGEAGCHCGCRGTR